MRQRLGLANALLRRPRLLVLDEPTNGLDPQGIREIRALLLELNAAGTTVFVSSHLLAEIEQMCTRVGVLDRGRLVLQEQLDDLRGPDRPDRSSRLATSPDAARAPARRPGRAADGDRLLVRDADAAALNAELVGAGVAGRRAGRRAAHPRGRRAGRDSAGSDTFARVPSPRRGRGGP